MTLPTVSSGTLYAHYDASVLGLSNGANVTSFTDLSGNGFHLNDSTSTLPTFEISSLNGLSGVVFTNAQEIRRTGLTTPAPQTVFQVCQAPENNGTVRYMQGRTSPLMAKWSNADRWIFGTSDLGGRFIEFTESGFAGQPVLMTYVHQATGAFLRFDQVQKVSGNILGVVADDEVEIGNNNNTGVWKCYERIVYDGALDSTDIDAVEDYLYNKWFVAAGDELTGTLFQNAPSFPQGAVTTGTVDLAGSLFQKAPTFPQGTVTPGSIAITGTLFENTPVFPTGQTSTGIFELSGSLFQTAPTFPTGTVAVGSVGLSGVLFSDTPSFFAGALVADQLLSGSLFTNTPLFPEGSIGAAVTWRRASAHTKAGIKSAAIAAGRKSGGMD